MEEALLYHASLLVCHQPVLNLLPNLSNSPTPNILYLPPHFFRVTLSINLPSQRTLFRDSKWLLPPNEANAHVAPQLLVS